MPAIPKEEIADKIKDEIIKSDEYIFFFIIMTSCYLYQYVIYQH